MTNTNKTDEKICECGKEKQPLKIFMSEDFFYMNFCDECFNKKEQIRIEEEKKRIEKEKLNHWFNNSGLHQKQLSMTFETLKNFDKEVLKKIEDFMNNPNTNIMLYGTPGNGKTHLVSAIINQTIKTDPGKYYRFNDFIKQIRLESINESDDDIIKYIIKSNQIICLDDIGTEKVTDFILEKVYDLFDLIDLEMRKGIIISSNYTLKQLSERLSDRIVSRIAGNFEMIKIKGEDNRLK